MAITSEHAAAERAFRELLPGAGLPQPDEVEYRDESVVFLWHESKLAVIVDLDGTGAGGAGDRAPQDEKRGAPRGGRPPKHLLWGGRAPPRPARPPARPGAPPPPPPPPRP